MRARPTDEPFFRERDDRAPGERRSLDRARLLAEQLGLPLSDLHPLVVVGSKGKGTAASYAAARLHQAGRAVGLITSPGYRTHHERIRLDGVAIPRDELDLLSSRVARALDALPRRHPGAGYLSPYGAFTVTGLTWLVEQGCDALVVEAGMGGGSDESSLTHPSVVAVTQIFEDHLGMLGDSLVEIAEDKAAVMSPHTRAVLSAPQDPRVLRLLRQAADRAHARLILTPDDGAGEAGGTGEGGGTPEAGGTGEGRGVDDIPGLDGLPTPLMRMNARLGIRAAEEYLGPLGAAHQRAVGVRPLPAVSLPGRLSVHHRNGQTWVLDSAISPGALRQALDWCRTAFGEPSTVLLSIPDSKDVDGCIAAVDHPDVRLLRADTPHLTFSAADDRGPLPTVADLDSTALGRLVLAVGTLSFVADALDLLDVNMTHLW